MSEINLLESVVRFWRKAGPGLWFSKAPEFDREVAERFLITHERAASGALDDMAASSEGSLALVLLLDQFPRNMFRGSPRAFATDDQAREVARRAIEAGQDKTVDIALRPFMYLPFEHAENATDQDEAVRLMESVTVLSGDPEPLRWAVQHRDIIRRFGRFPHRNTILGRSSTAEEVSYLAADGFGG